MASSEIEVVFFDIGDTLAVSPQGVSPQGWVAGAKETLVALAQKGVRLGILSNTGDLARAEILDLLPADFPLAQFAPGLVVFSSEVGHQKPSPGIFELAAMRAGIAAQKCLYCSENLVETLAAQAVGMRAARMLPPVASEIGRLTAHLVVGGLLT